MIWTAFITLFYKYKMTPVVFDWQIMHVDLLISSARTPHKCRNKAQIQMCTQCMNVVEIMDHQWVSTITYSLSDWSFHLIGCSFSALSLHKVHFVLIPLSLASQTLLPRVIPSTDGVSISWPHTLSTHQPQTAHTHFKDASLWGLIQSLRKLNWIEFITGNPLGLLISFFYLIFLF